jgi:hypothetical protein
MLLLFLLNLWLWKCYKAAQILFLSQWNSVWKLNFSLKIRQCVNPCTLKKNPFSFLNLKYERTKMEGIYLRFPKNTNFTRHFFWKFLGDGHKQIVMTYIPYFGWSWLDHDTHSWCHWWRKTGTHCQLKGQHKKSLWSLSHCSTCQLKWLKNDPLEEQWVFQSLCIWKNIFSINDFIFLFEVKGSGSGVTHLRSAATPPP